MALGHLIPNAANINWNVVKENRQASAHALFLALVLRSSRAPLLLSATSRAESVARVRKPYKSK